MKRRVVITGLGVISPVGNDIESFWRALISGKSGIGPITSFDASNFDSRIAGEVKDFEPTKHMDAKEAKRMEKFAQFAVAVAKQAVADAGLDLAKEDANRIGVIVGSGIGSLRIVEEQCRVYFEKGPSRFSPFMIPMLIVNEAAGHISISLGLKGPNSCVATACASGSHAIGDAFRIVRYGDADIMLAGGTESCVTALGVGGFCALKALSRRNDAPEKASRPFDKLRDGFVMAEGAGIVVLESLEHALKRNARIYAEIAGYGMSADAYHMTAPDATGDGAMRAMQAALADGNIRPEEMDYINAHGTSTFLNDKIETLAIKKAFGSHAYKIAVNSTKSMTGHLLGAAGGVEFVVLCLSIYHSLLHPTINQEVPDPDCDLDYVPNVSRKMKINVAMSNSLGFGGHNATLVAKKFKE
ncbi:MAG: beta-ketoacyl-[acyl-carrier-protein] synthase II [Omnitrophica WOR_2 bacterium RIFCSPLOWO2_12_FULL_46_30]|nr:MAG: beta-ketoacyl-[acyl-carrier-protein] synthase II [Omnitrophica WOR_2 bacterium RIFCSPHIGHO2_02_FULL_46_37]OGX42499.1 MAG: beta-ketoacyl-[acyl-carrier-protein] synthase II [Omnitrophica WOR_2 bacterium RIFCSPLOWO2_02_FULL_45_28]OGX52334.1 MAG: beta-ketoacyl-[acyl-carrier-protein] synthase II [Omnitrophica WOR_2 bacterium RIFCSPLOWO2_12_FULL_46_30]